MPPARLTFNSLQYLRAIAAWMVVIYHTIDSLNGKSAETIFAKFFYYYGNLGVDIFFVLSGFIMAHSVSRKPVSAWVFFADRLTRIMPAYWVATAVFVGLLLISTAPAAVFFQGFTASEVLKSLVFWPHMHSSGEGNWPVLTVGWTLVFEMTFYAILAIGLLINKSKAIWITLAAVLVLPGLTWVGVDLGKVLGDFMLYEFAAGLVIYMVGIRWLTMTTWPRVLRFALSALCMIGAAACLVFHPPSFDAIIACLALIGFVLAEDLFTAALRWGGSFIKHLGDLSYSTYLLHLPAIIVVAELSQTVPMAYPVQLVLASILTYGASVLSYRWIETQLRSKLQLRPKPVPAAE